MLAIDPGPTRSAWVDFDGTRVRECGIDDNADMRTLLLALPRSTGPVVIEGVQSFGMAVGADVFQTCIWIGRFWELAGHAELVYRKDVKIALCGTHRATDTNIRHAILDRYGGKAQAVGRKKDPGPLYGVKSHIWSALAVAITYQEMPPPGE